VLLDHRSSERNAGDGHADAQRVVRKSDLAIETRSQIRKRRQIRVLGRRRIAAAAFQQDQVPATLAACGADRFVELRNTRQSGGNEERLAGGGSTTNQGEVHVLEGRDLVAGNVETLEQVDRGRFEGGAEGHHAQLARASE
jgi:hypothetical protein